MKNVLAQFQIGALASMEAMQSYCVTVSIYSDKMKPN